MERSTPTARPVAPDRDTIASQVWALSDGRAGNLRQCQALAHALGATSIHARTVHPRPPWRWLSPRRLPAAHRAFEPALVAAGAPVPELVIGCGRQAALATRLLRARGARAVQILDPRLDPTLWDLVIAPVHDGLHGGNVLSLLGSLHPVDDLWLAKARAAFAPIAQLPQPRTTVLVGGPSRHAPMDAAALGAMLEQLDALVARDAGSLLLTGSRRTPPDWREVLRRRYASANGILWLDAADGTNPYPGLLAWADRIVCTPDSVNMVSEACATDVPVFVFAPGRAGGRIGSFLDDLLARGRIRPLDAAPAPFPVEPLRETARVAAEVRQRLHL